VLDLRDVIFMSCGPLGVLIDCATRARELGISLLILPSAAVTRIAAALGVSGLLGLHPSGRRGG
jgi:anti-anti-sigma regulatory factor